MDLKFKDNSQLKLATFTQLEYIKSTGTQWIDTGIIPTNNTKLEIEYQLTQTGGSWKCIIGGRGGSSNTEPGFGIWVDASNKYRFNIGLDNIPSSSITHDLLKHTVILNNATGVVNYDSTEIQQTVQTVNYQNSVYIGCNNEIGITNYFSKVIFYKIKFYDGNTVIANFIPALYDNSVVCMYDTVSETFFYNQGTGDFIAGPKVKSIVSLPHNICLKTTTLYHKNTPNVDGQQLLNGILKAQETAEDVVLDRIRVDIGNVSGSISELLQYAFLKGFNDNYEPQDKPRLVGTWTVNYWYNTAQLVQAQAPFDGLTIVGDPNYVIDFSQMAVQVLDDTQPNYNPGMAIVLQAAGYGVTFDTPVISGQSGRWMLTKAQAANITLINHFINKDSVVDSNKIVSNQQQTYNQTLLDFKFFGVTSISDWALERTNFYCPLILPSCLVTLNRAFYDSVFTYIHILSITPPTGNISEYTFSYSYKIYIGDGSSAAHDDAILADYVAASGWSSYASRLDTWYNYLHPTI